MKERFTNVDILIKVLKTFNILFIIGMCWLFADAMMTCFSDSPVKASIYAIVGGLYIGAYGAMTSQLWIDTLEEKKKNRRYISLEKKERAPKKLGALFI